MALDALSGDGGAGVFEHVDPTIFNFMQGDLVTAELSRLDRRAAGCRSDATDDDEQNSWRSGDAALSGRF
jgi:hypothetical protein